MANQLREEADKTSDQDHVDMMYAHNNPAKYKYKKFLARIPRRLRALDGEEEDAQDTPVYQEHLKKMLEFSAPEKLALMKDEAYLKFCSEPWEK